MRKLLATIAAVCFTLAAGLSFAETKPKDLNDFKPLEDTYPVAPDEHPVLLAERYDHIVFRLDNEKGECTGVVLANSKTRYYQRLDDIGCEPVIDHVSMLPSEVVGYTTLNFYHKTINVGRLTIHQ
ncbi:hypothetical protein BIZ78_gp089 [Erwinia phage vB_EamM_Caitlin]|uniref:hypothetical protein n=1 Tax=Erwinia phage vB_EamM_Caitlin TaxID=1883379 RepID=UPI00081CB446|nr:hypothetical protein BIZ78_gp089 [Erwinia phage vB_EamM_Caitlin]ANZ48486.1 hypothetical protein CAITLIN_191 [Erwinia phage vB_EamM_Caitlin]